jgi:hypothetical protein
MQLAASVAAVAAVLIPLPRGSALAVALADGDEEGDERML